MEHINNKVYLWFYCLASSIECMFYPYMKRNEKRSYLSAMWNQWINY